MKNNRDNVIEFRRSYQFNIGIVICIIIFIYVVFRLLSYVTAENVTIYEVKEGTIVSDNNYRALIIRDETVVSADTNGYVYFFATSGSRVGVRSLVYAVDETGAIINDLQAAIEGQGGLSESAFDVSGSSLATFVDEYQSISFQKTYTFKEQLSDSLNALRLDSVLAEHQQEIDAAIADSTYHTYYPERSGLISYTIDGLEGVTENDFSPDVFSSEYETENTKAKTEVSAQDVVYKLITSDDWKLVMPVDASMRDKLEDESAVLITFETDGNQAWGGISFMERDDVVYLILSLDDSMERYSDLRFVGVELKLDEQSGLKIPNSAIIEKEFFTVPKEYFLAGDNSNQLGLLKQTEDGTEFVSPEIFKETDEVYYINSTELKKDDKIVMPDSLETYTIGTDMDSLKGVYNANKGYAVFKQIEPIKENEEYTIIKNGTSYGIALYDHIVLQGDNVSENEIIRRY